MATKSIIDIDVEDSQFKAFYEIYQKFQSSVEEMPASWKAFNSETNKSKSAYGALIFSLDRTKGGINEANKSQKSFNNTLRTSERLMHSMASNSAAIAKNIFGIGKFLLKLSAVGLAGTVGGAFGLGALGNFAVSGQRQARGLGLNQGQMRAFGTDFGRYVSPGMLSNMAGAQSDFTKRQYLAMAAGVSYGQAGSESVDQLAIQSAIRAHQWWQKTAPAMRTQQTLQAAGFGQVGFTMEDMRRLGNTPMSELMTAQSQYKKDVGTLSVTDKTTSEWYKLTRQLALAGQTIETVLVKKLGQLAPTFSQLTDTVTKDISKLINSITPADIDKFANGIKDIASYLGSPAVLANLKSFMGVIESFLRATGHVVQSFAPATAKDKQQIAVLDKQAKIRSDSKILSALGLSSGQLGATYTPSQKMARKEAALDRMESAFGLPKGLLDSMWLQESSRGKNMLSPAGAIGDFGMMPKTAQSLKINPHDFGQSAFGASKMMQQSLQKYRGNMQKALAAYNWGSGNLDKDIAAHGNDWQKYAPKETQKYVTDVMSRINQNKTTVTIINKTGADMYTTTNAMAH